jgi:hypothetical protein
MFIHCQERILSGVTELAPVASSLIVHKILKNKDSPGRLYGAKFGHLREM